ncbi:PDDEXK family nuclease [Novosphingobium percolationis]|uniref:hypothetical protein n=1 Tax=Novosphingobium percolationis TaxID=2871811 RepID=UPI001CD7FF99|nr:hypothetical protein [Novosphingobium percolationis]
MSVIQTLYRGIKFRSRAEARWAVVFDALGWRYDYEPEGYRLPSGSYLPDFYLPELEAFFEVKGRPPDPLEFLKASELCVATEHVVILSHGPPNPHRNEWDRDLSTFSPDRDTEDNVFSDWHEGGFVSGRFSNHPPCSIDLGNLGHLGGRSRLGWKEAFLQAANHRFGVHEK